MLNKRGSIWIIVIVFLSLFVTGAALFSFIHNTNQVSVIFSSPEFLDNVYAKKNVIDFYIYNAGENSIKKTYNLYGYDENFNSNVSKFFKEEFESYSFSEDYMIKFKDEVSKNNYHIISDKDLIVIEFNSFKIEDASERMSVSYSPKISVSFNLTQMGIKTS